MSYAANYASALMGPFREAVESAPTFDDRYQNRLDPANRCEALMGTALDFDEVADILVFKSATINLGVLSRLRQGRDRPTTAYQVSR